MTTLGGAHLLLCCHAHGVNERPDLFFFLRSSMIKQKENIVGSDTMEINGGLGLSFLLSFFFFFFLTVYISGVQLYHLRSVCIAR